MGSTISNKDTVELSIAFTPKTKGTYEYGMITYTANNVNLPFEADVYFRARNTRSGKHYDHRIVRSIIEAEG